MGKLSIVATPIGNLEDMTLRALRTLKEVDVVLCEDTRVTGKLLKHYDIDAKLVRCDAEKEKKCIELTLEFLEELKNVAYVTDAGTPGISDPGARLVDGIREKLPDCNIEAIPGPSALTAALSIAGISDSDFTFLGFLPHKKRRETLFKEIAASKRTVVFYESPHRIIKTLESLLTHIKDTKQVHIARELTKLHEEMVVGTPQELLAYFAEHSSHVKGEFVVIVK